MKLITIVIPTYNMERYLKRCIESLIIKDSSLFNKLEIIIVNDGSKDNSLNIAIEYRNRFPETIIVIDKPNGNYGSCINKGIEIATGKYFRILDADDSFNTKCLISLVNFIDEISEYPDLILTNYQEDYTFNKSKILTAKDIEYKRIYNQKDLDFRKQTICVMHGITYKTDILRASGLKHQEGISYTDSEYCFYPLNKVQTVIFLDIILYRYQIGREGQTVSERSYIRNIKQVYMIIDRMLCYLENNINNYPDYLLRNQKKILLNSLKVYYSTILTNKFQHSEDLVKLDNRIYKFNKALYNEVGQITCLKIPVVKIWRMTKLDANNIIYNRIFKLLKVLKAKFL